MLETIARLDEVINAGLQSYRTPALVEVFIWITHLGANLVLFPAAIAAALYCRYRHHDALLVPLWVVFLGAKITTWVGKHVFDRARPEFLTGVSALSPSFPSGHATGAMALYGFLAYVLARELRTPGQRLMVLLCALGLILSIGFSRVFLSVHYTSDVLVGWLIGGAWLLAGCLRLTRK